MEEKAKDPRLKSPFRMHEGLLYRASPQLLAVDQVRVRKTGRQKPCEIICLFVSDPHRSSNIANVG